MLLLQLVLHPPCSRAFFLPTSFAHPLYISPPSCISLLVFTLFRLEFLFCPGPSRSFSTSFCIRMCSVVRLCYVQPILSIVLFLLCSPLLSTLWIQVSIPISKFLPRLSLSFISFLHFYFYFYLDSSSSKQNKNKNDTLASIVLSSVLSRFVLFSRSISSSPLSLFLVFRSLFRFRLVLSLLFRSVSMTDRCLFAHRSPSTLVDRFESSCDSVSSF